jgi:hypothetical protein
MKVKFGVAMFLAIVFLGFIARKQLASKSTLIDLKKEAVVKASGSTDPHQAQVPLQPSQDQAAATPESNPYESEDLEVLQRMVYEDKIPERLNDPNLSDEKRAEYGQVIRAFQKKQEAKIAEELKAVEDQVEAYAADHQQNVQAMKDSLQKDKAP